MQKATNEVYYNPTHLECMFPVPFFAYCILTIIDVFFQEGKCTEKREKQQAKMVHASDSGLNKSPTPIKLHLIML